jgi:hypothetical protein
MQKIDDIQRASIRRSEAYLRKKAHKAPNSGNIREWIAGAMFAILMIALATIILTL